MRWDAISKFLRLLTSLAPTLHLHPHTPPSCLQRICNNINWLTHPFLFLQRSVWQTSEQLCIAAPEVSVKTFTLKNAIYEGGGGQIISETALNWLPCQGFVSLLVFVCVCVCFSSSSCLWGVGGLDNLLFCCYCNLIKYVTCIVCFLFLSSANYSIPAFFGMQWATACINDFVDGADCLPFVPFFFS